jgi:hypothetical protein
MSLNNFENKIQWPANSNLAPLNDSVDYQQLQTLQGTAPPFGRDEAESSEGNASAGVDGFIVVAAVALAATVAGFKLKNSTSSFFDDKTVPGSED